MKNYVDKAMTFGAYVDLIDRLLADRKTTGENQSDAMYNYALINRTRMSRLQKTVELHEPDAESMVRAALEQGSDVEVLSGDQGAYLDRTADGIAARLRFAIDAMPAMVGEQPAPQLPAA